MYIILSIASVIKLLLNSNLQDIKKNNLVDTMNVKSQLQLRPLITIAVIGKGGLSTKESNSENEAKQLK